jgi:hypothetical protein
MIVEAVGVELLVFKIDYHNSVRGNRDRMSITQVVDKKVDRTKMRIQTKSEA